MFRKRITSKKTAELYIDSLKAEIYDLKFKLKTEKTKNKNNEFYVKQIQKLPREIRKKYFLEAE